MDINGAILNLSEIRSISKHIETFNYSEGFLLGVNGFSLNPLKSFRDEFKSVVEALMFLDNAIFKEKNVLDNQEFVFHFQNDVAEMDCVTFLTINKVPFFVDIEVKDTPHIDQLKDQLDTREKDSLIQLNFEKNYIFIGFMNGLFKFAVVKSDSVRTVYEDFESFKVFFAGLDGTVSIDVRSLLKDVQSILKIQDIKAKIQNNNLKLYSATRDVINFVEDNIKNKKRLLIIYGNAGCGKTVAALSLFYKYKNIKFLVLNKNLYSSLHLYEFYKNGTCFFGTDQYINGLDSQSIAIVDECQRLTIYDLTRIIQKARAVILLGDNNQAFCPNDLLLNEEEIKDYLVSKAVLDSDLIVTKRMKKTARYNSKVNNLLEVLHNNLPIIGYANQIKEKVGDEFSIGITMSENEFFEKYKGNINFSKLYMPIVSPMPNNIIINGRSFSVAGKEDPSFSIENYYFTTIGNTYHAISFDVDNSFVVLKNIGLTKRNEQFYLYDKNRNPDLLTDEYLRKFSNQINILFTRGRKSLYILVDDFYVFSYLNFKIRRGVR